MKYKSPKRRPGHFRRRALSISTVTSPFEPRATASRDLTPTRILIADSHPVVRAGLRAMLDRQPDLLIVGECQSAAETLVQARATTPNLVLLEYRFPDGSGSEVSRLLLQARPATRIFMVTMSSNPAIFRAAVEAGVHGFVTKDIGGAELLRAVRTVAGGGSYLQPEMVEQVFTVLKNGQGHGQETGLHLLSPQEQRIVPLVAEGKTNKEIGTQLALSEKTVKNYLANVFAKLGITRRTQAATLYLRAYQQAV